jgi:truncated hemoglobin YjbI
MRVSVLTDSAVLNAHQDLLGLLGGAEGVTAAIEAFHRLLLADPTLAPAFAGLDMAVLRRHHTELLNYLLGGPGPQPVSATGLRASHLPHRVTEEQFSAVVAHLVAALPHDIQTQHVVPDIVERLNWLRPHVVYDQIVRNHPEQVIPSSDSGASAQASPPLA